MSASAELLSEMFSASKGNSISPLSKLTRFDCSYLEIMQEKSRLVLTIAEIIGL